MTPTPEQQAVIRFRGGNLLVAASAGTGKTEVLARRCLALLTDPHAPCGVDQLLVMTFTRAAAAELRERIGRMLHQSLRDASDSRLRIHLARQLDRLNTADIGTIDAWCLRLVQANAEAAGIDPNLAILSPMEAAALRNAELDALFDELLEGDGPLTQGLRDLLAYSSPPSDETARKLVLDVCQAREKMLHPEAWLAAQRAAAAAPPAEMLHNAEEYLCACLAARLDDLACQTDQLAITSEAFAPVSPDVRLALVSAAEKLRAGRGLDEVVEPLAMQLGQLVGDRSPRKGKTFGQAGKALCDVVIDKLLQGAFGAAERAVWRASIEDVQRWRGVLLEMADEFATRFAARKRERSACEFNDVLRLAIDLLSRRDADGVLRPTPLALECRARYAEVVIDEFQDTSPLQVELMRLVSHEPPDSPNRFMVGDVKQSIYAFRSAEPALFIAEADDIRAGRTPGAVLPLRGNFRSHAGVIRAINEVCARLFDRSLGGVPYDDEARLVAAREEPIDSRAAVGGDDEPPRMMVHVLPNRGAGSFERSSDELPLEIIEREALVIADELHRLRNNDVGVPRRQPDGRFVSTPLTWSDAVVLVRAGRGNAPNLARMLRLRGVPAVSEGRDSLLDWPETRDLKAVLDLLANKLQDIPLAAYLRGPLVGLNEADLLRIRRETTDLEFAAAARVWSKSVPDDAARRRVREAFEQLDDWRRAARGDDVAALVRRVIRESGLRLFARSRPTGSHRELMLDAFQRMADDFARRPDSDVGGFVDYLDQLSRDDGVEGVTAGDVVRVMTIHAAKGLEFPIVFLANVGAQFNNASTRDPVWIDEQLGLDLALADVARRRELLSPTQRLQALQRIDRERSEELRLLYVAMTRARERLYVIGHSHSKNPEPPPEAPLGRPAPALLRMGARCLLDWVLLGVGFGLNAEQTCFADVRNWSNDELYQLESSSPITTDSTPRPAASRAWVAAALRGIESEASDAASDTPAVLAASAFKNVAREDAAWLDEREFAVSLPELSGDAASGAARGLLVHRFLEHANLSRLGRTDGLNEEIRRLVDDGVLAPDEPGALPVDDLAWWFSTREFGELASATSERLRRELPFVYRIDTPFGEPLLVRGVIDCLLDGDDPLLLDYKTDRVTQDEFQRRAVGYALQVRIYAAAAAALLGRPIERLRLVWLARREVHAVTPAAVTFDDVFRAKNAPFEQDVAIGDESDAPGDAA